MWTAIGNPERRGVLGSLYKIIGSKWHGAYGSNAHTGAADMSGSITVEEVGQNALHAGQQSR